MALWEYRARLVQVIDGDTLRLLCDTGFSSRHEVDIRLLDVHAPELDEPGGGLTKMCVSNWVLSCHDKGLPWPMIVRTIPTTTIYPTERRSFTRYVAIVRDALDATRYLNDAVNQFLAEHPEWGTGQ